MGKNKKGFDSFLDSFLAPVEKKSEKIKSPGTLNMAEIKMLPKQPSQDKDLLAMLTNGTSLQEESKSVI